MKQRSSKFQYYVVRKLIDLIYYLNTYHLIWLVTYPGSIVKESSTRFLIWHRPSKRYIILWCRPIIQIRCLKCQIWGRVEGAFWAQISHRAKNRCQGFSKTTIWLDSWSHKKQKNTKKHGLKINWNRDIDGQSITISEGKNFMKNKFPFWNHISLEDKLIL